MLCLLAVPTSALSQETKAGQVVLTSGKLNVRTSANTDSKIITTFKSGRKLTLVSKVDDWWKVEYKADKYGYCHADYISEIFSTRATVNITSGVLNVRKKTSVSSEIKATLQKGRAVLVLATGTKWSRILYSGSYQGYVRKIYLKTDSAQNLAVKLSVPDFKQTDSRWANEKIGSSGKTIGQIGCATTAIAMMESYRKGSTIYPDAMAKKLNYSSSGNVYWPSDYTVVTSSSNYLNGILTKLKQNKPVLFGAKKSSGSQHWVVVTGFSGGDVTAKNFTINDPGSSTRKNLGQLLSLYPTFYKYFYY